MEFLQMGGYAASVWPSFGITFAVVILNIVWARRALARAQAEALRRVAIASASTPSVPNGERA